MWHHPVMANVCSRNMLIWRDAFTSCLLPLYQYVFRTFSLRSLTDMYGGEERRQGLFACCEWIERGCLNCNCFPHLVLFLSWFVFALISSVMFAMPKFCRLLAIGNWRLLSIGAHVQVLAYVWIGFLIKTIWHCCIGGQGGGVGVKGGQSKTREAAKRNQISGRWVDVRGLYVLWLDYLLWLLATTTRVLLCGPKCRVFPWIKKRCDAIWCDGIDGCHGWIDG